MEVTYLRCVRQSDGGRAFSKCEGGQLGEWKGEIRNHLTRPGALSETLCVVNVSEAQGCIILKQ